jgi:spore germination cell wall hydrolase CwlJ-like protein
MVIDRVSSAASRAAMRGRGRWRVVLALSLACALPPTVTATPTVERVRIARPAPAAALPSLPEPAAGAGQAMTPEMAVAANRRIPFSREPILAARPFAVGRAAPADQARALDCLTDAVYYEAASEPIEGQRAVAQVVLNRVRHPAFPKSVCGVVFQGAPSAGCQFTFACDGSMRRAPVPALWARARAVAQAALNGHVMAGVGEATHYHADYVAPDWGGQLTKIVQVGAHIFYRWAGGWGQPAAFRAAYAGAEPTLAGQAAAPAAPDPAMALAANLRPPEPHAPDDVGGRVELGHGWTPSVPTAASASSALDQVLGAQKTASGAG